MGKKKTKKDYSVIEALAIESFEIILDYLDIEYENRYTYYTMPCPIHGGENRCGFSFSIELKSWKCWSTSTDCNDKYSSDIFGFICGIKKIRFQEAVDLICRIIGFDKENIPEVDYEEIETRIFANRAKNRESSENKIKYDKDCLSRLKPHPYFIKRGFKRETLDYFQCGFAEKGKMQERIVFPIIDLSDDIIGFCGRIIYEKCNKCGEYHDTQRNCGESFHTMMKWKNSYGFKKDMAIYNLNNAKDSIIEKKELIVVEGAPDIMRLHQIGVKNAISLLSATISMQQIRLLLSIGYFNKVYLFTDSDAVGKNFKNKNSVYADEKLDSLSRYFNVEKVELNGYKDIGDMPDSEAIEFCKEREWL